MEYDESEYIEHCQRSKKFNRFFSIIFILFSVSVLSFTFLPLIKTNSYVMKHVLGFSIFFAFICVPLIGILIYHFVYDMIEGNNISMQLSIMLIFLCYVFRNTFNNGTHFVHPIVLNIDLIVLFIGLTIYSVLDGHFYNKLKGSALITLQVIKNFLIICASIVFQIILYVSMYAEDSNQMSLILFYSVLFGFLMFPLFLFFNNYKRIIPKSGLVISIIVFVCSLSLISFIILYRKDISIGVWIYIAIVVLILLVNAILSTIIFNVANSRISILDDIISQYQNNISDETDNIDKIEE